MQLRRHLEDPPPVDKRALIKEADYMGNVAAPTRRVNEGFA
jgi:hypothetical protein